MDGDGKTDLIVLNTGSSSFGILSGKGDGTFGSMTNYPLSGNPVGLAVGDFNRDGAMDVAVAVNGNSPYTGSVELFLGRSAASCTLTVSPSSLAFDDNGAASTPLTVTASGSPCAWTASPSDSWITASPASGTGNGTLSVSLAPNTTGVERTGSISIGNLTIPVTEWGTSQTFTDVTPTDYFFDAANLLYANHVTSGCTPTTYCPTADVTRAQMAIFIVRSIYGGDIFPYSTTPHFTDVQPTDFGFAWIQAFYELGITTGCGPQLYCPDESVSRDQMSVFIIRARYGSSYNFYYPPVPYFTDVQQGAFAFNYIQRMKFDAITSGCTATTYCPSTLVTRGDMAIFIMRGGFNQLLPVGTPILSQVSPTSLTGGQATTVTVTGMNTNFLAGSTTVDAGGGAVINSWSVLSPTSLSVSITATGASQQHVSLIAITGPEQAVSPNQLVIQ